MWQGDGASLAPGPKRCRVMTAVAAAATAAAPAAAASAVAEAEAVVAMKRNVKDIKRWLDAWAAREVGVCRGAARGARGRQARGRRRLAARDCRLATRD